MVLAVTKENILRGVGGVDNWISRDHALSAVQLLHLARPVRWMCDINIWQVGNAA